MKKKLLLTSLIIFQVVFIYAQKQSNTWYFGRDGVGLDFNCIPPTVVEGHAMIGWEGVATVSDRNTGEILFYTNGSMIFDRNHNQLPDGSHITPLGSGFIPLNTSTQVLPIPSPANENEYFIIATDIQAGKFSVFDPSQNGIWAVKVDMTQNGGLGAVVDRFQIINPLYSSEKLMGVPHDNGSDYWLLMHDFGTNDFFISLVDNNGIQIPPTIQSIGLAHDEFGTDTDNLNSIGELKASPDATMVASTITGEGNIELFDFDNNLGVLSNARSLGTETEAYGASFSPDNSKLYITTWQGKLIQFDLNAGSTNDIINSKTTIFEYVGGSFGSLKIAPDEKIYVSRFVGGGFAQDGGDTFLGVINNPNEAGVNCNYVHDGVDLGGKKCNWGLNNVIEQTEYEQVELIVDFGDDFVGDCEDPPFFLNAENDGAAYLWQDGSMLSTFEVSEPGTYFVEVTLGNCMVSDTIVYESEGEINFSFGDDLAICPGDNILLDASEIEGTYLWQDGSTVSNFSVAQAGTYSVTITNDCGTTSDEIEIFLEGNSALFDEIQVPNTFTPDGDGVNDMLSPVIPIEIADAFSNYEFKIFNRWGNSVFSSNSMESGWDGKIDNSRATSDVYVWVFKARAQSCNGEVLEIFQNGDVTLIR